MFNRILPFVAIISFIFACKLFSQEIENQPTEQHLIFPTVPIMETVPSNEKAIQVKDDRPDTEASQSKNNVDIGLSMQVRQQEANLLNRLLADEFILYVKTIQFHWNVQGIVFHDFHAMFQEQYKKLFEIIDELAERTRALGAPALGSLQEFLNSARLTELIGKKLSAREMIQELLSNHEALIRLARADIETTAQLGDQGTSNLLQEVILQHEKIAWMLRTTLAE